MGELGRSLRSAITPTTALEAEAPVGELLAGIPDGDHVLLVVDQFEEVFTACADEPERAAFLAALEDAANRPRGGVTVVLAIRADHYGRCAENPALAQLLGSNHVLVGSMTGDEYRRAIEQPALRVGVHVEPALTEALVALEQPEAQRVVEHRGHRVGADEAGQLHELRLVPVRQSSLHG